MTEAVIRTFLIGDVRGYTSFTQANGDEAAARLAGRFAQIMREAVESRGGEVIELRGDEALAVFTSARQALRAAVDIQLVFADEVEIDPSLPLRVGIGIDAGEAVPVEKGYRGGALNLAARLCSKAQPGEVLASQGVIHLARTTEGLDYHDHGEFEMKGLPDPVTVVLITPAGMEPGALGARLDAAAATKPVRPVRTEVPAMLDPLTPMIGREHEARALRWAWRKVRRGTGAACVIVGPAGIGKTRLAAEAADLPSREGAHVVYVGCADISDDDAAAAIGATDGPTLLVVDDSDVAGPRTLSAVSALVDALSSSPLFLVLGYQEQQASAKLTALAGRLVQEGGPIRPAPLDLEGVRQIAALYLGGAAGALPASSLETTGGIPRKVHEFVSEWAYREASRRLGDMASRAASDRSGLRSVEAELAGSVVDLQFVQEQSRLFAAGAPDRGDADRQIAPFKGLASFDVGDAAWFYGRERLVAELIARLAGSNLLGVVGPSGSGKSSAVRAGFLPALRAGALPGSDRWIFAVMRPGEHPLRELDRAVWAAIPEELRAKLAGSDVPLRSVRDALNAEVRFVLLIDQFEEVFTACNDEAERSAFISAITEAASDRRGNEAVVLAVRADFYGRCASDPSLASLMAANHILVGPMTADEYRRAIDQPAIRAGLRVEPALADALVAEVVDEPGGLPLLSTALLELWERREGRTMRIQAYVDTGGVRGAVARLAEDAFGRLTEPQQGVARSVMLRLAGPGEGDAVVRRRVPLAEFESTESPDVATVVDAFTDRRLLTVSEGSVEVAHEALLREWPRLQGWIEEDRAGLRLRTHLTEAAKEWEEGREDPSELYRGTRLASALDWTADHTLDLNDLERRFLGRSREAAERAAEHQRRTNRRLRGLLAGVALLLVFAIVAGSVAAVQRTHARTAATDALAQSLGAQGVTQPQLSRALLLARVGVALAPSNRTEGSLLATLLRAPGVVHTYTTPENERPLQLALVGDGRTLAMGTNVNNVHFYDVTTSAPLGTYDSKNGFSDLCCAAAPDGAISLVETKPSLPVPVVIDPRSGKITRTFTPDHQLTGLGFAPLAMAESPDGKTLYLASSSAPPPTAFQTPPDLFTWIYRWDIPRGNLLGRTAIGRGTVVGMNVTHGGSRISVVTGVGEVQLDATSMRVIERVPFHIRGRSGVGTGAISADGTRAVVGTSEPGVVDFVDLRTGKVTQGTGNPITQIDSVAFSPTDPSLAVTTGDDGRVVLWDAATARVQQVLPLHAGRIPSVTFAADGSSFFTVSLDGTALEWGLVNGAGFGSTFDVLPSGVDPSTNPIGFGGPPPVAAGTTRSAFSQGGTHVAVADNMTGKHASFSAAPKGYFVFSLALSPDGRTLAVGSEGGRLGEKGAVQLWDVSGVPRFERTLPLNVPYPSVNQVAFADGGKEVLAATGNTDPKTGAPLGGYLVAWRTSDGSAAFPPILFKGFTVRAFALSIAETSAAVALGHGPDPSPLRFVSLPSGTQVASVDISTGLIALAFGQDGSLLAGDYAGHVQRWSVPALKPLGQPILAGGGPLGSVSAVPNASLYVTADFDGTTKLWDLASGQQVGSSFTPLGARWMAAPVSADGSTLVAFAQDGSAWSFPLSRSEWAQQACRIAGRNLTPTEWSQFVGDRPFVKVCPQYPLARSDAS
ncbi:MAG: AAA family ATPase [Actinomycetota bacterium]|nr:AAA family ATPase [Actinomycetota bacterium]